MSPSLSFTCLFVRCCWEKKGLKGPLKFDIDSDVGEVPIIEYLLAFTLEPCAITRVDSSFAPLHSFQSLSVSIHNHT
jgi:hypothetical protein